MKRHTFAFILAIAFAIGLCIPVSATGMEDVSLELIPVDASELIDVSGLDDSITDKILASEESLEEYPMPDISPTDGTPSVHAVRNSVSVHYIEAKPIVQCQETGQYFRINDIKRSATWADGYQTRALRLTTSETAALKTEIINKLAKNPTTAPYTWEVAGWHIYTEIYLDAQNPLRIEFRPTCSRYDTFEYRSKEITSQYTRFVTEHDFLASDVYNDYFFAGIEGNFYFKYATGSEGGALFYSILALNSNT